MNHPRVRLVLLALLATRSCSRPRSSLLDRRRRGLHQRHRLTRGLRRDRHHPRRRRRDRRTTGAPTARSPLGEQSGQGRDLRYVAPVTPSAEQRKRIAAGAPARFRFVILDAQQTSVTARSPSPRSPGELSRHSPTTTAPASRSRPSSVLARRGRARRHRRDAADHRPRPSRSASSSTASATSTSD